MSIVRITKITFTPGIPLRSSLQNSKNHKIIKKFVNLDLRVR